MSNLKYPAPGEVSESATLVGLTRNDIADIENAVLDYGVEREEIELRMNGKKVDGLKGVLIDPKDSAGFMPIFDVDDRISGKIDKIRGSISAYTSAARKAGMSIKEFEEQMKKLRSIPIANTTGLIQPAGIRFHEVVKTFASYSGRYETIYACEDCANTVVENVRQGGNYVEACRPIPDSMSPDGIQCCNCGMKAK